jgi:hypothetical protein
MSSWLSKTIRPDNELSSDCGHAEADEDAVAGGEDPAAPTEADGLTLTRADVAAGVAGLALDPHPAVRRMTAMMATRGGQARPTLILMALLHAAQESGSTRGQLLIRI